MKKCNKCSKFPFCDEENEKNCTKFEKRSYDTKLVKVDGDIKIIERIEE